MFKYVLCGLLILIGLDVATISHNIRIITQILLEERGNRE